MRQRRRVRLACGVVGAVAVAVLAVVSGGCAASEGDAPGTPLSSAATTSGPGRKGSRELTAQQGQKLLRDIQKNPSRLEKLTPQEKRYLARAAGAKAAKKAEEDAGR